jgi:hypothetical protein
MLVFKMVLNYKYSISQSALASRLLVKLLKIKFDIDVYYISVDHDFIHIDNNGKDEEMIRNKIVEIINDFKR